MHADSPSLSSRATLARLALTANAVFSATTGVVLLAAPGLVASALFVRGEAFEVALRGLGLGLVSFALAVGVLAARLRPRPALIVVTSAADLAWSLATPIALVWFGDAVRPVGLMVFVVIGVVVFVFAVAQLLGVRAMLRETRPTLGDWRYCVAVDVDVDADALWRVVSDVGSIARYLPDLARSTSTGPSAPGVGTVRTCTHQNGDTWSEACTLFDPNERRLDLTFLTEAEGFPFPVEQMFGGWQVSARGRGSRVTVWWSLTPRLRVAPWLGVALLGAALDRQMVDVISRMASAAAGEPPASSPSSRAARWRGVPC